MCKGVWAIWAAAVGIWAGVLHAHDAPAAFDLGASWASNVATATPGDAVSDDSSVRTFQLAQIEEPPNVYPEFIPGGEEQGINGGAVNFGLDVDWMTDYVYRGLEQSSPGRRHENALQFNANAEFDLGKLPHPFIGLFVNVFNSDPISRFEEVRPYFGLDWNLRPLILVVGFNSYIFPNRKNLDTQEVYASITFDDSLLFRTPRPIFSPYVYGAYDFSLYNGFYLEAGLKHDFIFEDLGLTMTPRADVAYVLNDPYFEGLRANKKRTYGLQHFDVGLLANYSLNHFFKVNHRYGEWSVTGTLYYTAGIDRHLRADTLIWGGVGLEFRY